MDDLVVMAAQRRWSEARRKAHASPHGTIRERQKAMQAAMTALLEAERDVKGNHHEPVRRQIRARPIARRSD
tara:strand:- start:11583 stop:11798 length:216 start_codon:yes stop_codon:yes gene_type:complete